MLRFPSLQPVEMSNLNEALTAATTETVRLIEDSPLVRRTLGEINLRGRSGATLIAVQHGDETKISPGASYKLEADDVLILSGKPEKIARAMKILQPGGNWRV